MELVMLVVYSTLAVLYMLSSFILLRGISGFRARLRIAYTVIVVGFIIQVFNHTIEALAQRMGWWEQAWFETTQAFGYTMAPLLLYFGVRAFGRLLQIRTLSTSFMFALATGIPVSVIGAYLGGSNGKMNAEIIFPIFILWLLAMATVILVQTWRQASKIYQPALYWLVWPVAMLTLGAGLYIVDLYVPLSPIIVAVPYVVGGAVLYRTAQKFYKIRNQNLSEFKAVGRLGSSIDIIIYTASLASSFRAVDSLLDQLRMITARVGDRLGPEEQAQLKTLYLQLEDYLANDDPVRTYDRELIRDLITRQLNANRATTKTFWPELIKKPSDSVSVF